MRTESGRCLIFAMQMVSGYLARLARAARRVQGPRRGTFRKLHKFLLAFTPAWRARAICRPERCVRDKDVDPETTRRTGGGRATEAPKHGR